MKTQSVFLAIIFLILGNIAKAQNEFQVHVKGKGQAVLLFPGFTCTSEVYSDLATSLENDFEVHSFTFAGFGGVAAIEKPWLPKIKESIENYVNQKKLKNPIIIGHSMGGTLGLWLASENPNTYKKLIIIDALPAMGALMVPNYNSENIVYDNPFNKRMLEMEQTEFNKMASQMAKGMSTNPDFHKQLMDWIIDTDRETYVYGYTDLLKLDLRENLSKITIPVTILGATHPFGKETAEENYKEQYKNLNNYKLYFAEGAGHFIMYDKPEWFLKQITNEISHL